MQIVYQEICGDFELITKVEEVEGPGWAGVIARENLTPGSPKMALKINLDGDFRRDRRDFQDGAQASLLLSIPVTDVWLRMVRTGNLWFLYTSPDGSTWILRNSGVQGQPGCVLAGVFTESVIVRIRPPVISFDLIMTRALFINTSVGFD